MAYILLLLYFLVVIPNVFCENLEEEFCPNQTSGSSSSPKAYGINSADAEGRVWMDKAYKKSKCGIPVCNVTGDDEQTIHISCPGEPVRPNNEIICGQMGRRDIFSGDLPFCCGRHYCEPKQVDVPGAMVLGENGEPLDYPTFEEYMTYEELHFFGKLTEKWGEKSCKNLGFQIPKNCKLLYEEAKVKEQGGCNYECEIPLMKTILVENVTRTTTEEGVTKCQFTHKEKIYSPETRNFYCEKWDCKEKKLYIHTCIRNTSTIQYPTGCYVLDSKGPYDHESYPNCCAKLICVTMFPWEFGAAEDEYMRAFA